MRTRKESRGNDCQVNLCFRKIALVESRFGGWYQLRTWRPVQWSKGERITSGTTVLVDGTEGDKWMD